MAHGKKNQISGSKPVVMKSRELKRVKKGTNGEWKTGQNINFIPKHVAKKNSTANEQDASSANSQTN